MSMNALTSFGLRRARSQKHAGGFEDLFRATQLMVLLAQLLDLFALLAARQIRAQTAVSLGLADPLAQHLVTDAEIARDRGDRTPGLKRETDTALDQLLGILPGSGHELAVPCSRTESSFQSLRETQGSSIAAAPAAIQAAAPAAIQAASAAAVKRWRAEEHGALATKAHAPRVPDLGALVTEIGAVAGRVWLYGRRATTTVRISDAPPPPYTPPPSNPPDAHGNADAAPPTPPTSTYRALVSAGSGTSAASIAP
jgi:hypothetical protein